MRTAAIDIGTNSVLLLVAERAEDGRLVAVQEEMDITRLGRGVDRTGVLAPEAMRDTLAAAERFAQTARALGASFLDVTATSAARDAQNGPAFLEEATARLGAPVRLLSGDEEAQLSFSAAAADFEGQAPGGAMVVIDIGGGSTELIFGRSGEVDYRHSFNLGAVRLTERHLESDPPSPQARGELEAAVAQELEALPTPAPGSMVVGVAGTVTTLYTVRHRIDPYDAARVQGGTLSRDELDGLVETLCALPLEARKRLPGLPAKRADVLPAGALLLRQCLARLGATELKVSDRGLRWGLVRRRLQNTPMLK